MSGEFGDCMSGGYFGQKLAHAVDDLLTAEHALNQAWLPVFEALVPVAHGIARDEEYDQCLEPDEHLAMLERVEAGLREVRENLERHRAGRPETGMR